MRAARDPSRHRLRMPLLQPRCCWRRAAAFALGLGQIVVKVAAQPLVGGNPDHLHRSGRTGGACRRLASPKPSRRVGLAAEPPVANLDFAPTGDARGRPVIRVTTVAPVSQAVLTFLLEVDWGFGPAGARILGAGRPRTASAPVAGASAPVVYAERGADAGLQRRAPDTVTAPEPVAAPACRRRNRHLPGAGRAGAAACRMRSAKPLSDAGPAIAVPPPRLPAPRPRPAQYRPSAAGDTLGRRSPTAWKRRATA